MLERQVRSGAWEDPQNEAAFQPLTRAEAQALRDRQPQVPVWWVVAAQAALGGVVAVLAWLVSGDGVAVCFGALRRRGGGGAGPP